MTVAVLVALALVVVIRDDRKAMLLQLGMMVFGMVLIGVATLGYDAGLVTGATWMVLLGTGMYIAYVPPGCFLFDRLMGATKFVGTAVFMIFVTDAFGYAASVGVILYREFFAADLNWLQFLRGFAYVAAVMGTLCFGGALLYFANQTKTTQPATAATGD